MARSGKYQRTLKWLNTLGGWEYWNFEARKTYGYEIRNTRTLKRDVFQDWSTNFTGTESEHLSLEANEQWIIRSQALTKEEIDAIAQIKISIKVIDVITDSVVLVDKGSFSYRTDAEKLHFIEFQIRFPDQQMQSL